MNYSDFADVFSEDDDIVWTLPALGEFHCFLSGLYSSMEDFFVQSLSNSLYLPILLTLMFCSKFSSEECAREKG